MKYWSQVDEVIRQLGLEKCADVVIGTPLRRGVSGGQAKRVNAGMELITNPSILFLDEPTSGMPSSGCDMQLLLFFNRPYIYMLAWL
jgi:ABC-type multidrug transport system ATPase subunit